jgi:hypothetical protein
MATIDPSIAMGYKPIQIENPLNQLAAYSQIQSGQQNQQLNALQMQKAQLELDDRNMLRGLDPNAPDYISNITRINPQLGLELLTKEQTRKTQQIDRETKINNLTQQMQRNLSSDPSDVNINKNFDRFVSSGLFDANHIADAKDRRDQLLALPLTDRVPFLSRIGASAGDLKPVNQVINAGGQVLSRNLDPYSSKVLNEETIQKTPTIADKIAESNLGINQQELALKLKRFDQDTKSLTPQETALLSQAILEGRLDPNAVNSRNSKILATTLSAKPDANLVELNLDVVGKKAGERTLATTGANVQVAANEAKQMINLVLDYSNKVDRTQYPTINSIQNAIDRGTGGVEIVQLNAALNALVNTYARAINPKGVSTVSSQNHAREVINSAYSKGQINAIADVMQQEMDAALKSTGQARSQIRNPTTSNAGASPTTVTTSDGKTYNFPTPEAADKFKQAVGIK